MKKVGALGAGIRNVNGQKQVRLLVKTLSLPSQLDAVFQATGDKVILVLTASKKVICSIQITVNDVKTLSGLNIQKVARFVIATKDSDEYAMVAMNVRCLKRFKGDLVN